MNINELQFELDQKLKNKSSFFNFIKNLILEENCSSILDMFHSSLFKELETLYGQKFIKILKTIWGNTLNFTYEVDPLKPAFRDKNNMELYIQPAMFKLWYLLKVWQNDFNIMTLITPDNISKNYSLEDIIAYEIDNKNNELLLLLSTYIKSEKDNITTDIIRGIIKSSDYSLYLKLFELLPKKTVNSKLKKNILTNADRGNIEAFKTLTSFILNKKLFSSNEVIEAIAGWTGIELKFSSPEEVKLFFIIINDVLIDKKKRNFIYSQGNESEYIFFSLWAEGLKDFPTMKKKIFLFNDSKNNMEVLNALHYLYLIGTDEERREAAMHRMKKKVNPLYAYYVVQNYITHISYPNRITAFKYSLKTQREMTLLYDDTFFKDKKTLNKHFEIFYKLAIDMHQYLYSYEKPFCWSEYIKDPEGIFYKLFDIVAYDNYPEEKIDRLCDIVIHSTDEVMLFFLTHFIKEERSEKQRNFVLFLLKEGSSLLKERAVFYIKSSKVSLSSEEKEAVINLFDASVKNSHRVLITSHILDFQRDLMLEIVSEIILTKNNPLKKEAAETFLKRLRKDNTFPHYLESYKKKKEEASMRRKKAKASPKETEITPEKEKNYLQKSIKKSGFRIYDSQKAPFLFEPEDVIISEIPSIKDFFNLNLEEFEAEIINSSVENFLQLLPLNNLLEIDFALRFEVFFDLDSKQESRVHSVFSLFITNSFNIEKMEKISILARKKECTPQKLLKKINNLYSKFDIKEIFNMKMDIINCFFESLSKEAYLNTEIIDFMKALFDIISDKELNNINMFRTFFFTYYVFYCKSMYQLKKLDIIYFLKAFSMKLIPADEVYKELLERENSFNQLSSFLNLPPEERKKYSFDPEAESKIISTIVKLEINRKGESKRSELTHLVPAIKKIEGISLLFSILEIMEYERIEIVYDFSLKSLSKKDTLNYFLSISQPAATDTIKDIKELILLLDNPYSLKNLLLLTAIHILKWRPLLSEYLNCQYLDEVHCFFKTHLNYERSFENRMTLLKYTSIKPEEFEKGRFDIKWFKRLYNLMGELEFEQIYDSYKKKFSKSEPFERFTASLSGIFNFKDIESLEKEVKKQNKKALLCYSLINYKKFPDKPLENIYDTIRYHAKTSDLLTKGQLEITIIALNNFLDNIGFSSRAFLELSLDKEYHPLLRTFLKKENQPSLYIALVPPNKLVLKNYNYEEIINYQKEKYIMKAYEAVQNYNILIKDLVEYLKHSMHTRGELVPSEIFAAGKNPLTSLVVKNIIFEIDESIYAFVKGDSFITLDNKKISITKSNKVKIAHPIDMPSDVIKRFKDYFKSNDIIQEFKQLDMKTYVLKNKEAYKKELIHFLDTYLYYNVLYEFLINHNWENLDENTFIKPYIQDNLVIKLEIKYKLTISNSEKTAYISSITFLNLQENKAESFSKIPVRILSNILYDLNHIFNYSNSKKSNVEIKYD
ncbi:DUF5724 domain-containing protein [Fusobacterium varium]|uniref:DUF5724 domain-containing protein n=1 Tax=Fusobacterium varium TaxID=856 RepID=UPI00243149FA|nr:DUF5724 domain-containing protein [Fusobacterium varium]MCI6031779.1 DUF4132 domain-containing protein [Fusobacterium varium]